VTLAFTMRPATEADLPLVIHAWVAEMRHSGFSRGVPDHVYFQGHRRLVLGILASASTLVAVDPVDAEHVYGCAVYEHDPRRLHWLYVKSVYRLLGVARSLFSEALGPPVSSTKLTQVSGLVLRDRDQASRSGKPSLLERYRLEPDPYVLFAS
jgi:hypothetical protein